MAQFSFFPLSRKADPEVLTTAAIGFYLEKMFEEAEQRIVIISPYIKISKRIRSILLEKKQSKIDVCIVYKNDFEDIDVASQLVKRKNLHAKCFFTDKAALIGSMNLYDYSQVNNDEMAIYVTQKESKTLYDSIEKEVNKLCHAVSEEARPHACQTRPAAPHTKLVVGGQYDRTALKKYFPFVDEYAGGIKETRDGNIVLFYSSKSRYPNQERGGIIYYVGQNTGSAVQALWYGNKLLYERFPEHKGHIFIFKDMIFLGECRICAKPFQQEGKWIFPLKLEKS